MVEKEYATALFDLAIVENNLNVFLDEFKLLIEAFRMNPDFLKVLTYPNIDHAKKEESLKEVVSSFSMTFQNFLLVILNHNRFEMIETIYANYENLVFEASHIKKIKVMTAEKLNEKQINNLQEALKTYYNGYNLEMSIEIDETLLGGIKVLANGEILDISIKNRLNSLKASL